MMFLVQSNRKLRPLKDQENKSSILIRNYQNWLFDRMNFVFPHIVIKGFVDGCSDLFIYSRQLQIKKKKNCPEEFRENLLLVPSGLWQKAETFNDVGALMMCSSGGSIWWSWKTNVPSSAIKVLKSSG